jgi:hypothetical protein
LSAKYDEDKFECQIESTQGYLMCHKCGQKATEFHERGQELELRHLPLCGRLLIVNYFLTWIRANALKMLYKQ